MRAYDLEVTGSLKVHGDISAENYIIDNTVVHMTQSLASGSTIFGDTLDDKHEFTGSLHITSSALTIDGAVGDIRGSSTSTGSFGRFQTPYDVNDASLNLYGNSQLRLGPEPYHATLNYNNNGNLDITARSSYNVDIVHGDLILTEGGINVKADVIRVTGSLFQKNGSITTTGNISGSATSTGSFGHVKAGRVSVLDESRVDLTYLPDLQFYEEDIYTATLAPQGSGTITINSDWNKLGFTRIGNKVHVHGTILVSAVSSPAGTNIALNLPYQTRANGSSTNGTMRQTGRVLFYNTSNWLDMPIFIDENDTTVLLLVDSFRTLGGDAPPNVNTVAASWQFRIDFHYFIGRFD